MKLYTCYYARYCGVNGVQISNSAPPGGNYKDLTKLSPPWELVDKFKRGEITQNDFAAKYDQFLERFDLRVEIGVLEDGDVLLCWEGKNKFCHRHLLAEHLRELGHEVTEL